MVMKRQTDNEHSLDTDLVNLLQHNKYAGAQKNLTVGPMLKGLLIQNPSGLPTPGEAAPIYTTDYSVDRIPGFGIQLWVYNPGTVKAIRFDADEITAVGAIGDVGERFAVLPALPGWSHFSTGEWNHVRAADNTLKVFILVDDTSMVEKK